MESWSNRLLQDYTMVQSLATVTEVLVQIWILVEIFIYFFK